MWAGDRVCFPAILVFLLFTATSFLGGFSEPHNPHGSPATNDFDFNGVFHVHGNVYPHGYYFTTLVMGEPPKLYRVDIDTGSDLTWVYRDVPSTKPPQNNALTCKDTLCNFLAHPPNSPCNKPSDQCYYQVKYADQGSSTGLMVKDKVYFRFLSGVTMQSSLAFGSSSTKSPFLDGVLGLANGKPSILSQLHALKISKNVFGLCLSSQGGGYLFFGDKLVPSQTVWVPMLKNTAGNHYLVGPADLLFGGQKVPKGAGLSFILDSGSTYTYLNNQVYQAALSMIKKSIKPNQLKIAAEDQTLPVCWKGAKPIKSISEVGNIFKPLALKFSKSNNAMLEMPPEAYLILSQNGNVCLGILNGDEVGLKSRNILGDISVLNKMVIYNNDKAQIGWATASCDRPRAP